MIENCCLKFIWIWLISLLKLLSISEIDECQGLTHPCHEKAVCINFEGSFACLCIAGYSGSGQSCYGELLRERKLLEL